MFHLKSLPVKYQEKISYCIPINASFPSASSLAASIPHFYSHLLLSFSSTLCVAKVTYLPFPQTMKTKSYGFQCINGLAKGRQTNTQKPIYLRAFYLHLPTNPIIELLCCEIFLVCLPFPSSEGWCWGAPEDVDYDVEFFCVWVSRLFSLAME